MHLTVIVAVFMALLMGESLGTGQADEGMLWLGYSSGAGSVALVVGSLVLLWSLMRLTSRMVLLRLESQGPGSRAMLKVPVRIDLLMRILVVVTYGSQLTVGGWGKLVCVDWRLPGLVLVDEVVLLAPFVIMMVMKWYFLYPLNRLTREYIVTGQLVEGLSARPVWSRRQYISFQIRHGLLIILAPLLVIVAFKDVVEQIARVWFSDGSGAVGAEYSVAVQAVIGVGGAAIFVFSPVLLRRIWLTRSLPDGPLRGRLEEFCKRLRLGYRDILLWDTYSVLANAAVMGLVGSIRYILLSDSLIENMSDEQIEAVFGHEAGHVKYHHIMFLLLFVIGSGSLGLLALELLGSWLNGGLDGMRRLGDYRDWVTSGGGVLLFVAWVMSFGWVSRKFERQADVHAAVAVDPSAAGTDPQADDVEAGVGQRGAYIVGSALQRIAMLNGISAEARSWRHSSISSRMAFLRHLVLEQGAGKKFFRSIAIIKLLILLSMVAGVGGWYLVLSKIIVAV